MSAPLWLDLDVTEGRGDVALCDCAIDRDGAVTIFSGRNQHAPSPHTKAARMLSKKVLASKKIKQTGFSVISDFAQTLNFF